MCRLAFAEGRQAPPLNGNEVPHQGDDQGLLRGIVQKTVRTLRSSK
jgi:hypothetical protein